MSIIKAIQTGTIQDLEKGDSPGHPFRGNQYVGSVSGESASEYHARGAEQHQKEGIQEMISGNVGKATAHFAAATAHTTAKHLHEHHTELLRSGMSNSKEVHVKATEATHAANRASENATGQK